MKQNSKNQKNEKLFFPEKTNKIFKPLVRLRKKKRGKTQINNIRDEKGDITTDTTDIQRIVRGYSEQVYANNLQNLEEMDKVLDTYTLPRLNNKDIEKINREITSNEN